MQAPPPPPPNDPFSPLIEAWQQAFLKTLHDPQAADSLWRGWNQLAGQWAQACASPASAPYGPAATSASDNTTPDPGAGVSAPAPDAGVAAMLELVRRIDTLEQRVARLESRRAPGDVS